jgi:hypothetical protein
MVVTTSVPWPSTGPSTLYHLVVFSQSCDIGPIISHILELRKLRNREVNYLAPSLDDTLESRD